MTTRPDRPSAVNAMLSQVGRTKLTSFETPLENLKTANVRLSQTH